MRRLVVIAVVLAAAPLTACGGGGSSAEDEVRDVAASYAEALADRDTDKACDLMSSEAKRQLAAAGALLGGGDCAEVMKAALGFLDESDLEQLRDFDARTVTITGDTATVDDNADLDGEGENEPTRLVRKGDAWLIAPDPDEDADETAGGSDAADDDAATDAVDEEADAEPQQTATVGEPLRQSDYTVTVTDVRSASELPGDEFTDPVPSKSGRIVIVELRVRNTAKRVATFDSGSVELVDVDGTVYSSETGAASDQIGALPNYLDEREIQPKTTEVGAVAFDVSKQSDIAKVQFADSLELSFDEDRFTGVVALD